MNRNNYLYININSIKRKEYINKNGNKFLKNKIKNKIFSYSFIIIIILYISVIVAIIFVKEEFVIKHFIKIKEIKSEIQNRDLNDLKVCVCTLAKLENKYIREFVEHYKKYGVDKIFLYDNNDIDGEKFDEILKDYIQNGFVQILNWRGRYKAMLSIMNDCYRKNYHNYDWLIFYEIDEYIHLYDYHNIKLFLNQTKFNNCQQIYLNLVCHTDNNLLLYENKSLAQRFPFTVPITKSPGQYLEMKTIIRGHYKGIYISNNHLGDIRLRSCNNSGKYESLFGHYTSNGDQKYYYIDHYYSKSTEEFIMKITKGDAIRPEKSYIDERIEKFFNQNEITKDKIDMIEKKLHINLDKYRKKIG